jgi:hypothetical protein
MTGHRLHDFGEMPDGGTLVSLPILFIGTMRRSRRSSALAALLLVLQFIVLGSGFVCVAPGMDDGTASAGMAQMDMSGGLPTPNAPRHAPSDRAPCSFPWAPANCSSMAPCAPAAVASPTVALLPAPAAEYDVERLIVLAPPSRSTPPELPPPRA